MKSLHIVRHAKSSWNDDSIADIDRPLKSKGIRNAYEMARKLKLEHIIPEKIVSSPANRALHTAVIFARIFEYPLESIEIRNLLYDSSIDRIIDFITKTSDDYQSLMIFGHNPDFSYLAGHYVNAGMISLPTAGVASLTFNINSWENISSDQLKNHQLLFPEKNP